MIRSLVTRLCSWLPKRENASVRASENVAFAKAFMSAHALTFERLAGYGHIDQPQTAT